VSENVLAIAWSAASRWALARLPEKVATAVVEFLYGSLASSPYQTGKPPRLGLDGLHSARRGDYRVIYRIDLGHKHEDMPFDPTRKPPSTRAIVHARRVHQAERGTPQASGNERQAVVNQPVVRD
jgi:mRNA interferase RelE/StbE